MTHEEKTNRIIALEKFIGGRINIFTAENGSELRRLIELELKTILKTNTIDSRVDLVLRLLKPFIENYKTINCYDCPFDYESLDALLRRHEILLS